MLLGVAVALPWFKAKTLTSRRSGQWICGLLGAQAISLVLSTVTSSRASLSVSGTNWRRFGLVTELALLIFTTIAASDLLANPGRLRIYLRAAAGASIPVALYGVAQYFGWDPWIPKQAYHIGEGIWTIVRPPGTLGYVTYFANYLVVTVFFGACLVSIEDEPKWRILGAAATALGAFAIVLSGTRGALLALAIGALCARASPGPSPTLPFNRSRCGGGDSLDRLFAFRPPVKCFAAGRVGMRKMFAVARAFCYGVIRFRSQPVIGWWALDPRTFSIEFPRVQSAELAKAYPDFYQESAHNVLLDTLTAQGLIGLLALGGWIGLGLWGRDAQQEHWKRPFLAPP